MNFERNATQWVDLEIELMGGDIYIVNTYQAVGKISWQYAEYQLGKILAHLPANEFDEIPTNQAVARFTHIDRFRMKECVSTVLHEFLVEWCGNTQRYKILEKL